MLRTFASSLLLIAYGALAQLALAHPVHTSAARADYNAETKRLEVSVALDSDDASHALSQRANRRIVLEREPAEDLALLLQAWLRDRFLALDAAGQPLSLHWVGHELKEESPHLNAALPTAPLPGSSSGDSTRGLHRPVDAGLAGRRPNPAMEASQQAAGNVSAFTLWLHFEIPAPAGPEGLRLAHLLLTDEFPRQENTLRVRATGRECVLSFRRGDPAKRVVFP